MIEGVVYFDENNNSEYDTGEPLISDVDIKLIFNEKTIKTTKSNSEGYYNFTSLIPACFSILIVLNYFSIEPNNSPEYIKGLFLSNIHSNLFIIYCIN